MFDMSEDEKAKALEDILSKIGKGDTRIKSNAKNTKITDDLSNKIEKLCDENIWINKIEI